MDPPAVISVEPRQIITSVVNDIIMPPIGKMMGGVNPSDLFINLDPSKLAKDGSVINRSPRPRKRGMP